MTKIFPIGKRPRRPFSKTKPFLVFLDEFGYYAHHNAFLNSAWSKLSIQVGTGERLPFCSFSTHRLRRAHPFLRRFLKSLEQRNHARVNQIPEPLGFIPNLTQALWENKSLLYWAVSYRDWRMVECMLHAGFDPNSHLDGKPSAMELLLEILKVEQPVYPDSIPHSILWLMMEKGGRLFETDNINQTENNAHEKLGLPSFVFQIYEEVQTKLTLERLPKANNTQHKTVRI